MTDPKCFESFMRSYQNMVYTTAYRLLANHAEAQDISQEVFLKAYDRFEEIRDSPRVGGWLKTVARNMSLNHLTRHRNRWKHFSDFKREGAEDEIDFEATLADESIPFAGSDEMKERRETLDEMLEKLPRDQRLAIVLFHFEDMPYQEIARKLKVSLSKVKTDIMRGRLALRSKLQSRKGELGF